MTAPLCATSKNLLLLAMMVSILLSCARFAAWWAALRRATLCSGVSPAIGGCCGGLEEGVAEDEVPVRENREEGSVEDEAKGEADVFDPAWGVVDVNRVASETERATILSGFVGRVIRASCRGWEASAGLGSGFWKKRCKLIYTGRVHCSIKPVAVYSIPRMEASSMFNCIRRFFDGSKELRWGFSMSAIGQPRALPTGRPSFGDAGDPKFWDSLLQVRLLEKKKGVVTDIDGLSVSHSLAITSHTSQCAAS